MPANLGSLEVKITGDTSGLDASLNKASGSLGRIGDIAKGVGIERLAEQFIKLGIEGVKSLVNITSEFGETMNAFTALTGSVEGANEAIGQLNALAMSTDWDIKGAQEAGIQLKGIGLEMKDIIPLMEDFNKISSAHGQGKEGLQSMVDMYTKVTAAGEFGSREVARFSQMGINLNAELAKLGKTKGIDSLLNEKARKEVSKLTDDFDRLSRKIAANELELSDLNGTMKFGGKEWMDMRDQTDEYSEKLGELQDKLSIFSGEATEGKMKKLAAGDFFDISTFDTLITNMAAKLPEPAKRLGEELGNLNDKLIVSAQAFGQTLEPEALAALTSIKTVFGNVFSETKPKWEEAFKSVGEGWDSIKVVLKEKEPEITDILNNVSLAAAGITNAFGGLATFVAESGLMNILIFQLKIISEGLLFLSKALQVVVNGLNMLTTRDFSQADYEKYVERTTELDKKISETGMMRAPTIEEQAYSKTWEEWAAKQTTGTKQAGGYISKTGLYQLHEGERVNPRGVSSMNMGGMNVTVNVSSISSRMDIDSVGKQIGDSIIDNIIARTGGMLV